MAGDEARPRFFGPNLIASNFAVTVAFYRDTLGLPLQGESPYAECQDEGAGFAVLDGRFWSQANQAEMPVVRGPPTNQTVLSIDVPDVDATFERLMASEVKFLAPPTSRRSMGRRNVFLRDPDGRMVELYTGLPTPS